ncbi:MAG: hypothetical protein AAFQ21_08210 [Pseudomonadota bacterium]
MSTLVCSNTFTSFLMLAFAIVLSGCGSLYGESCEQMHFASINVEDVTSVRLHRTNGRESAENQLAELSGREEIQATFKFLTTRRSKWRASPFGVPVGRYRIVFWKNEERRGSVSFGEEFLVGQGCGYFFAANVSSKEITQLASLLGVEDPLKLEF